MLYITYDNENINDGFGSQIQRILSLRLLCIYFDLEYIHSPILLNKSTNYYSLKDVADEEEVCCFNKLFDELNTNFNKKFSEVINICDFDINLIMKILSELTSEKQILLKIGYSHDYLDRNFLILESYIPPKLSWINNKINNKLIIAIHIRRGDVSEINNSERFTDIYFYIKCINNLSEILYKYNHIYHIYSESLHLNDTNKMISLCDKSKLDFYINTTAREAFVGMVNSDILITSKSSFSYATSFLRQKGIILYIPIRHNYNSKHISLENTDNIYLHKDKIINSITSYEIIN
jgi:hypothetical protein